GAGGGEGGGRGGAISISGKLERACFFDKNRCRHLLLTSKKSNNGATGDKRTAHEAGDPRPGGLVGNRGRARATLDRTARRGDRDEQERPVRALRLQGRAAAGDRRPCGVGGRRRGHRAGARG